MSNQSAMRDALTGKLPPGDGYRFLRDGEVIVPGDEFYSHDVKWKLSEPWMTAPGVCKDAHLFNVAFHRPYRRAMACVAA